MKQTLARSGSPVSKMLHDCLVSQPFTNFQCSNIIMLLAVLLALCAQLAAASEAQRAGLEITDWTNADSRLNAFALLWTIHWPCR